MAEGEPDDLSREADRWVADLSRHQPRRSWMVPLLAVPIGQVVTERDLPRSFFLYGEDVLIEARELGQAVLATAERVTTDREAQLTDGEAADVLELVLAHRAVLLQVLSSPSLVAELLGLPPGLSGDGLVRRLAKSIVERPEPPGRLAVLAASLLVELVDASRDRDYVPLPHSSFLAISRSLDLRCYQLGLRSWADGLRHAASVWTAETWHGLLLGFAGSNGMLNHWLAAIERLEERAARAVPEAGKRTRPIRRRGSRPPPEHPELARLRQDLDAERLRAEAIRAMAVAAKQREAELVQARDRAQARAAELGARNAALETELRQMRGELRVFQATLQRLQGSAPVDEPIVQPVPVEPLPADLLRGRTVFFFTGQPRSAAARAQAESLRALGPEKIKLYEVRHGARGPDVFPPRSVVVVDTRFVGHSHTNEIETRVRRSDGVEYFALQAGEGGLARKLAERLAR